MSRTVIAVIKAKDGTDLVSHGARLVYKDKDGLFSIMGGVRVEVTVDALELMIEKNWAKMLA